MPMWVWIAIGVGGFLGLSVLVGLATARVLGLIGRQISEMYETEDWSSLPPTRGSQDVAQEQPDEVDVTFSRVIRLR
jgi:hypothetical protein